MEEEIEVIKGDTLELSFEVENIEIDLIKNVYFSSRNLLTKEFLWDEISEKYRLTISSQETEIFPVGKASYDITIIFVDETVKTIQYRGPLVVYPKDNRVNING
jgi:hypothetical protein